jgi:hypothetical protein
MLIVTLSVIAVGMPAVIIEGAKGYAKTDIVTVTKQKLPASIIVTVLFIFEEFHHCFKSMGFLV